MNKYGKISELIKLILHCHRVVHGGSPVQIYTSAKPRLQIGLSHAAAEIPKCHANQDKSGMFDAVAYLAMAVGHAYYGSRQTAFLVAEFLLDEAGYQMQSNRKLIESNFDVAIQGQLVTEIVHLFMKHWQ